MTRLEGVPAIAWDYKLGNRSALEWILDQYKEKKPKDPTIAAKFNTYRFADYKEQVIDLLDRVCTVSVETMKIIQQMPETWKFSRRGRARDYFLETARNRQIDQLVYELYELTDEEIAIVEGNENNLLWQKLLKHE